MKQLTYTLFMLTLMSMPVFGQKSINKMIDEVKEDNHTYALSLPGWVINKTLGIATKHMDEGDVEIFKSLKDKIKKVRIAFNESLPNEKFSKAYDTFKEKSIKDGLESYAYVKHEDSNVNIFIGEKENVVKNIFFVINADKSTVLLHLKTDLTLDEFNKAQFSFHNKTEEK
jgi:hypothetical protein